LRVDPSTVRARLGLDASGSPIRARMGRVRPRNATLVAVLAALFVLNSGLAFAAVGAQSDYTFDPEANDYAFTEEERGAAQWLRDASGAARYYEGDSAVDPDAETVIIYTDTQSYQLFRSVMPEGHYTVEINRMKDRWDPTFDPYDTDNAYVFIRHRAIMDAPPTEVPVSYLSDETATAIVEEREVVYENEDVTIVAPVDAD
jgi:hypothetical protein